MHLNINRNMGFTQNLGWDMEIEGHLLNNETGKQGKNEIHFFVYFISFFHLFVSLFQLLVSLFQFIILLFSTLNIRRFCEIFCIVPLDSLFQRHNPTLAFQFPNLATNPKDKKSECHYYT